MHLLGVVSFYTTLLVLIGTMKRKRETDPVAATGVSARRPCPLSSPSLVCAFVQHVGLCSGECSFCLLSVGSLKCFPAVTLLAINF